MGFTCGSETYLKNRFLTFGLKLVGNVEEALQLRFMICTVSTVAAQQQPLMNFLKMIIDQPNYTSYDKEMSQPKLIAYLIPVPLTSRATIKEFECLT